MPSRLKRYQSLGQHHFITFSCDRRLPYLLSPGAKTIVLEVLEQIREQYDFQIAAYVIMPEHLHLIVSEPPLKPLATVIGVFKRNVSRRMAQKPFWLDRYYDFNISSNEKLVEKLRYIHRNPVARELVARPEDYVWSSFRDYALLESGAVRITRAV